MAEKTTSVATREGQQQQQQLTRRDARPAIGNPARMLERFADEMDRLFDDFGVGGSWLAPRWGRNAFGAGLRGATADLWMPPIEMYQRNNELVVRADLPGMKKEDVKVDVADDAITIQGERRSDEQEEREGVYRSERSYGSFRRAIALPEGAMTEQAKATFKDGVLEIRMPAPPEHVNRGRRLDITEGADARK